MRVLILLIPQNTVWILKDTALTLHFVLNKLNFVWASYRRIVALRVIVVFSRQTLPFSVSCSATIYTKILFKVK